MNFKSQYHKSVEDLVALKGTLESDQRTRRERRRVVKAFSNGLATMTEEEAKKLGQTEIVNHLTTFKYLYQRKRRLENTYTSTRSFVEIKLDTDNPEWDTLMSIRMTKDFNRICLYGPDGLFRSYVKALSGEVQISGGAPVMRHKRGSWVPKLALNILLPRKCSTAPSEIPYTFAPEEFTLGDLEDLLKLVQNKDEGQAFSKKAVKQLIDMVKKKPKGEAGLSGGSDINPNQQVEKEGSTLQEEDSNRNATIDLWWYYEVKDMDKGEPYVSGTLFSQEIMSTGEKGEKIGPMIIAHFEKLFSSTGQWMHLFCMDMEIGGDTTYDSVRGIAEIMFPSASEIEILLNLMLAGDKERAKPKYQVESNAVNDDILSWDSENTNLVPTGIKSFDMKGSTAPLQVPMQFLLGNVAGLGSGEVSNSRQGGELRQQAVGRQRDNTEMQFGDMSDWTFQQENVMLICVEQAFMGTISPGTRGYSQAMALRACMTRYYPKWKELFARDHGRLKYITVRVRRVLGEGGLDTERNASSFLLQVYPKIAPANRPKILQSVIATETQDPDLAEDLVKLPVPIINAQKLTAENECDTIMRRALLGEPITTNVDDVDMDHIPVHMKDMVALLSLHQLEPWKKLQVIQFTGLQRHTQDHFENVLGDKDVRDEALDLLPQMQAIVAAAQQIVALVEEQEGQADQQLSPKEQADLQLKMMAEHRKGIELGMKMDAQQSLDKQRLARQAQVSRTGYVRELESAARLELERRKMGQDAVVKQAQVQKTRADTEAVRNPEPATA